MLSLLVNALLGFLFRAVLVFSTGISSGHWLLSPKRRIGSTWKDILHKSGRLRLP